MWTTINKNFVIVELDQPGSVFLSDILQTGADLTGFSVAPVDSALNDYFEIGPDPKGNGNMSILYTYIGTKAQWDAASAAGGDDDTPVIEVQVILSKAGFNPATITLRLRYTGSIRA